MKIKKKSIILTTVAVATLIALVVGATYAYFQATGGVGANANIKVETATTDLLTFNFSKSIAIYADQSNFGKGAGNQSDSTKGTATLTASNSANIASTTDRYNIYFIIDSNDFVYTTSDSKTELLLQVTDPNGNEVTAIDGLLYKDGGFDITTRTGGFLLVPDYDISASRGETTKQEWNITVTLVNLDTDQSTNMGKTFSGKLYMTKDQMSSYELTQISNMNVTTTYNSIDASLEVTNGSAEITKYYFGKEKLSSDTTSMLLINKLGLSDVTFIETTNPNYKFNNLDANSTYKIYSYAVDKNGIKSNMYETEVKTDEYVVPTVDSVTHTSTLNSITVNVAASKGSNEVVKYYYSKDDGETYIESTESSYTFTSLADTAEYKIKIKVEDSDGKFSTVYSESINTVTYILPTITTVTPTTKYNQITVATTATGGTNSVSKYYYSINNGAYVEDGTSHTFAGLTEQTTYTIKVKVVDTNNRESVEYSTSAKTDAYKLPTVTIASTSSTYNSIKVTVTGTNGDGTITEYYYSKDNGSNYVKGTGTSYTFTGLTDGVTFNIKVYVKDSNGRVSEEYYRAVSTDTYVYPSVTAITQTTTYNSIKVTPTVKGGTNSVSKYYYSINNGTYVEDTTSHTFTGLTDNTSYTIKVKVSDTDGRSSTEFSKTIKTSTYTLPSVKISSTSSTTNSITVNVTGTNGTGTVKTYYYSVDNGSTYKSSTSTSYTFTGLTAGTSYTIKVYVKDSNGRSSSVVSTSVQTSQLLADWVKAQYTGTQGDNNLYYHNGTATNAYGIVIDANDNSYRYAGSSDTTNNFVCFGSDEATCPDDNLYRIIGVFGDLVKLIKWDYATAALLGTDGDSNGICSSSNFCTYGISYNYYKGSNNAENIGAYYWNYANRTNTINATNRYNVWSYSKLNTVNLNTNFLKNIGTEWASKIATTTWKVGGVSGNVHNSNAATAYANEYTSPAESTTENAKVGLMYMSDYGFAASRSAWNKSLYTYYLNDESGNKITEENWMYMGLYEWTLVPYKNGSIFQSYAVDHGGSVAPQDILNIDFSIAVRPVFYLNSDVTKVGNNTGTKSDPIRIN